MFNFTRENRANYNIFWQKLRVENVLLLYLEQIVSFWAVIFSNTNSLKLFYENPSLNIRAGNLFKFCCRASTEYQVDVSD